MYAIDMKPFSTLVLKHFTWVIATTTKICTKGYSFLNYFIRNFLFPLYILLLTRTSKIYSHGGKVLVIYFSVIHFRDRFIRQVSCYTLLSGYPTSVATVLLSRWIDTLSGFLESFIFDTLTFRLVHPTSPVLLTRYGPLMICFIFLIKVQCIMLNSFLYLLYTTSKFENKKRILIIPLYILKPIYLLIIIFTWYNYFQIIAILRENSEGTSY